METITYVRAQDGLHADGPIDLSSHLGNWINTNTASRGIVEVILSSNEGALAVQAFGACDPSPCDWGRARDVVACAAGPDSRQLMGFTAEYDFCFLEMRLEANLSKGLLIIASFNTFRDGSERSDFFSREFFFYQEATPSAN